MVEVGISYGEIANIWAESFLASYQHFEFTVGFYCIVLSHVIESKDLWWFVEANQWSNITDDLHILDAFLAMVMRTFYGLQVVGQTTVYNNNRDFAWKQQVSFSVSYTMNNKRPRRISFLFLTVLLIFLFSSAFVLKFLFLFLRKVLVSKSLTLLLFIL